MNAALRDGAELEESKSICTSILIVMGVHNVFILFCIDKDEEEGEIAGSQENASQNGDAAANDPDERSVFVKNVDYGADQEQLKEHFKLCGEIERVTIRKDSRSGQPLG